MSEKGHKKKKLEERILLELNDYLRREVSDGRLVLASFTKVVLNNDSSLASAYWDSFNSDDRDYITEALEQERLRMKSHLARVIRMRQIPNLKFTFDAQYESEKEIETILNDEAKKGRTY